jgi:hypothetical protein
VGGALLKQKVRGVFDLGIGLKCLSLNAQKKQRALFNLEGTLSSA